MHFHRFMIICLFYAITAAESAEAVITQNFDQNGKLTTADIRSASAGIINNRYSLPDGAGLRSDVHYEFYPVFGKTFAEIVRSAEENGPRIPGSKKRSTSSYTWKVGWSYDFSFSLEPDDETEIVHCDLLVTDPVISYDITLTLPVLTDDSALNPIEKELWKNFFNKQLIYEHGHVRIIKDESRDSIMQRFGEIAYISLNPDEADNAEKIIERFIKAETEKIGSEVIGQIRKKLEAYDAAARLKSAVSQ